MKRLFLLLTLSLSLFAVSFGQGTALTVTGSPVTAPGTANLTGPTTIVFYESGAFQTVITRTSGVVAGSANLQGTVDGTNWVTLTTVALTDVATQSFVFTAVPVAFSRYRVSVTTSGTSVIAVTGTYRYKVRRS